MSTVAIALIVSLVFLLLLNIPIAISLGLETIFAIIVGDVSVPLSVIPQRMITSIDSFPFMAIPFFMLAGDLMVAGGISRRLVAFVKNLVGFLPGGLGIISVFSSAFFGSISGSNAATVSAIGNIMIPEMKKEKYPSDYSAAVIASSGTLGVVIPPSVPMITYGVISGVSIGTLFLAGIMPAILMLIALCITTLVFSRKHNLPKERTSFKELIRSFGSAFLALLLPFIILGGIYGGIFTPTEAAAVACVYALIVTVFIYREIKIRDLPKVFVRSGKITALVFFVIATSGAFSWLLTSERIPSMVASTVLGITDNAIIILLMLNIILIFFGLFLETNATILLLTPILLPIAQQIGMDPIVLGIIIIVNTSIGMLTPPLALNVMIASSIGKVSIESVSRKVIPFFIALIIVLLLITYLPDLIMFFPNIL